jgi:nucleoid-associated protein EbfC
LIQLVGKRICVGVILGYASANTNQRDRHMKDLMGMMKQAQELQGRMQKMQEDMAALEVRGQSGGGLVMVMLDGKGTLKKIKVDPSLMVASETEILEDLIIAAADDARGKVETQMQAKMQEVTGGLPLPPGLKLW